ncbi:MAG TPA: hypothetical protein VMU34_24485 [Mycobacterium sp.]|nr:hypothetical protein [Mycobacterium sp.]
MSRRAGAAEFTAWADSALAGVRGGDLGSGPTVLVDTPATLRALAGLAVAYADPARCAGIEVAAGSALAGWWVERGRIPARPRWPMCCGVAAAVHARGRGGC